jgi:uncharacterized cupredoxin-like copper-binding protein
MKKNTMKITKLISVFILASVLLVACGGGGGGASGATTVNITLTDFVISSSLTDFKVGVPYHFVVKNNATVSHEIWIDPVDPNLTPDTAKTQGLAGLGQDILTPGSTQSFDYTFTKAYPSGAYEFACHLPGHYEAGMHVGITVQ